MANTPTTTTTGGPSDPDMDMKHVFLVLVWSWDVGEDSAPKLGASRSAIEKLMEKGSFVASEKDHREELAGTCSIRLEEFSSSVGAELLRMDCSHIYHPSCILPRLLDMSNNRPTCRRRLAD